MNNYLREPINGFTHLAGAILSFIGLLALVIKTSINSPSVLSLTAVIIFGISMILLYSASTVYHLVVSNDKVISFLRRVDHAMIFLLIAGSYTPFCLISLDKITGVTMFWIIFTIAIVGICFKLIWFNCPRWLSTLIYVAMGWMAIFLIDPLKNSLFTQRLNLLIMGGIFYTIGALIYATKPKFLKMKYLGYHEIFHIFIMFGTLCHFLCVFKYVI